VTSPVTIVVKQRGPYVIQGPIEIRDADGNLVELPPAKTPGVTKLCSCGLSATRPFCDGAHKNSPPS
jgi:CDGSH iron-sulfur domain-containing protein 3